MATTTGFPSVDQLLTELDTAAPGGYRAVLHGSAARGQHIPGWSDINVLLIFELLNTNTLERLRQPLRAWQKSAGTLPLMLSHAEWLRSADAYPLEIAEMRTGYRVLRGDDPLAAMQVRTTDLRQALERELRGKLLRLRQGYALLHGEPKNLGNLVRRSIGSVLFLCRGMLVLAGRQPAEDPIELVHQAGTLASFEGDDVARIVTRRGTDGWECTESDMRGYLAAVEQAARFVDHFQRGVAS
jgi:hypothetical protein